jgi:hypothetical protein
VLSKYLKQSRLIDLQGKAFKILNIKCLSNLTGLVFYTIMEIIHMLLTYSPPLINTDLSTFENGLVDRAKNIISYGEISKKKLGNY